MSKADLIQRYTAAERINHWVVAITFVLLALSGLALFHPAFFFLTNLFGGGPWTRILHPYIGLVMFVVFLLLALRFWRDNLLTERDRQWLRQIDDVMNNREDRLPPVGRYNAGQKLLFWVIRPSTSCRTLQRRPETAVLGDGRMPHRAALHRLRDLAALFHSGVQHHRGAHCGCSPFFCGVHFDPRHHRAYLRRDLDQRQRPGDDARLRDARVAAKASPRVVSAGGVR
jgi:thiosulfate reductase cytochrome b subunit